MTVSAEVFDELEASWRSCDPRSFTSEVIEVAGLALCIEGVGTIPSRLRSALRHHPRIERVPDLTVSVWDFDHAASPPRLPDAAFDEHGIRDLDGEAETRLRFDVPQRVVQGWHGTAKRAWWCAQSPTRVAWWEEAAPLRPVLAWWLTSQHRYFAHGAALATDGRATLLVGPGGSGKSTTALRAQRAGFGYLGDDYCLVAPNASGIGDEPSSSGYHVASLYRTAKLRPVDGPADEVVAANPVGRKVVVNVGERGGGPLVRSAELVSVASVELAHEPETTVAPGFAGHVLTALAPTSLGQLPGVGAASLPALATMLRTLPTARVRLGTDERGLLAAVEQLQHLDRSSGS